MMQLARDTGIAREGLYKTLGEQGNPSFATVLKVMHALGLQLTWGHRQRRVEYSLYLFDSAAQRFYSRGAQRKQYYDQLDVTQRGVLDVIA